MRGENEKTIPQKASRFIIKKECHIELEEYELSLPKGEEVLIRTDYSAVSVGTELFDYIHWMRNGKKAVAPLTTGYSCAGTVVAVGDEVTNICPGDRLCGEGVHSSHNILRKPYHKIPEKVSSKEASMTVLSAIALRGVRKARIQLGESVVVLGVGVIGQLALSCAKLSGAFPIIAIDKNEKRLDLARNRGADYCINPGKDENHWEDLKSFYVEEGADIIIEATGNPQVYPNALKLARTAGRIISLGSPRGTVTMNFLPELHKKELVIEGAFQPITPEQDHVYYHWNKHNDRNLILNLMAHKRLNVLDLITKEAQPSECHTVYELLSRGSNDQVGVVFDWQSF